MSLQVGFAGMDITPPLGTEKIGWLRKIVADTIIDPLYAHIVLLESGSDRVGFVSLDLLSITARQVARIREGAERAGVPGENVMVAATHNHAGPATCTLGGSTRDEAYVQYLMAQIERGLHQAIADLGPGKIGTGTCNEGRVGFIRRYIMKDGSTRTHPGVNNPNVRCAEGVPDPELAVLCVKDADGHVRGFLVNFACHPTHYGGDTCVSAGWPGQLSLAVKRAFGPGCVTVFLNGAFGNVHHNNPMDPDHDESMERIGAILTSDMEQLVPAMTFTDRAALNARSAIVRLPYRDMDGPHGVNWELVQQAGGPGVYQADWPHLRREIANNGTAAAEVQRISIGDLAHFVSLPGEVFVQLGLRIKMGSPLPNTLVVGAANGMLGYVPHRGAFDRGGYETSVASWSKLAPEAGDLLADAALALLSNAP